MFFLMRDIRFKTLILIIVALLFPLSCSDDEEALPTDVSFDISYRLLEGKYISCIETDNKGNIWIASEKVLYFKNGGNQKTFNLDFKVLDIAISPDESIWIGTDGGGLCHFNGREFTWFNKENAGLPRDYVRNVEVTSEGNVWFSSCAHQIGGLGFYNGVGFEFFTPENSPLNQNIIQDVEIGSDDIVYIATAGTVGKTNIYRISGKNWECLGDEEGTFYWINSFSVTPSGNIFLVEDFSLSSSSFNTNKVFELEEREWKVIETNFLTRFFPFSSIETDQRGYFWLAGYDEDSPVLNVYTGKSWQISPKGFIPADYITEIEADSENNIWIGTYANGVFILNQ
jgi:ligand-binding sensor domain-containing protein